MTITNRDGTIGPLAKDCPKFAKIFPKLPKIAKKCHKLPKIVIRKFCAAVSFHLYDTIGPLSKTFPKLPQITQNCQNSSKMCIFWSHTSLLQLEAGNFDWYILMSFWLWNLKDSWSLRVYKARNVLPKKNIKK